MTPQHNPGFDSQLLFEEKRRLSEFPYFDRDANHTDDGVLLSDWIEHYCSADFRMIEPFDKDCLRPAGYDLRVGSNYAIGGERLPLQHGGSLTINPYQVAVIQTLETLNIPHFLIGRWNIRVTLAYDGLLWVGGAQVDPGFRGRLSCPIYNLSNKPVKVDYAQRLAMIDFVTTTSLKDGISRSFQWWHKKKLLFQAYPADLRSGVEDQLAQIQATTSAASKDISTVQTRIDTFVTLVFTVVAVLFAALGIIATKTSDQPGFLSSPVWVAAIALFFALQASVAAHRARRGAQRASWYEWLAVPGIFAVLITGMVVAVSLFFTTYYAHVTAREVRQTREEASKAITSFNQQTKELKMEIQEIGRRTDSLQQQIKILQQNQSRRK